MKLLGLFVASFLSIACQRESMQFQSYGDNSAIVGGNFVSRGTRLAKQVAFVRAGLKCSGTFIAKDVVLTSAHCFSDGPKRSYWVGMGTDSRNPEFKTRVLKVVFHPQWTKYPVAANDLAILKIETPLPREFMITQLYKYDLAPQAKVIAVGFGRDTYTKIKGSAGKLKYASLMNDSAGPIYRNFRISMNAANGVSFGDSGGPLLVEAKGKLVQVGVAHGIYRDPQYFRVEYAAIRGNAEWIEATVNQLKSKNRIQ